MTRPKKGEVKLTGINKDAVPGDAPEDFWTDGRNVMFVAGETVRIPGEALFAAPTISRAQFVHYIDTGVQQWWIYGGDNGVAVTNGVQHYNITPAGWGAVASKNYVYTVGDLNTLPFVNHPERGPYWWDGDPSHIMTPLPDWPAGWSCRVMRAHKNFLMAGNIDSGAGLLEGQVSWSSSAAPGTVPTYWHPAPTNDSGDYNFAKPGGPIIDMLSVRDQLLVAKQDYQGVLQYVGGQFVFEGRDVFPSIGLFSTGAWIEQGNLIYMLTGTAELVRHDMTSISNILYGILQDYLKGQINYEYPSSVFLYRDDDNGQVGIAYPVGTSKACVEAILVETATLRPGIRDLPSVYGADLGLTSIESDAWDQAIGTWDTETRSWNQAGSGYQPLRVVFAGDTQGLIVQGGSNQQLGGPMQAYAARGGIDASDLDYRKTISGMMPRVQGNRGDVLNFQFGAQADDNSDVELTGVLPYVIGVDDQLDFFADGRLLTINVASSGGAPWKLASVVPAMRKSGRW
jgi:hypothetical protein